MGEEQTLTLLADLRLSDYEAGADIRVDWAGEVDIVSEEKNLAQALLHRIRTGKGELAELGHPTYGSAIFDFVGLPNTWINRERLRLAVRDAIKQESRVKEIKSITVRPKFEDASLHSVELELIVIPRTDRAIKVSFPLKLEES